jgi:O-antigen/teichoic acid export membrane protein
MGVVRRQSIQSSLFTYLGFAFGAFNILVLFPRHFSPEQIGLTRLLLDIALLFSTACTLGSIPILLKFYPEYQDNLAPRDNDLPFLTLMLTATGCLLLFLLLPVMQPFLIRKFGDRSPLLVQYFHLIYPFSITLALFSYFEAFAWTLKRTVLSNALKEFAFRLLTTLLILAVIAGWFDFDRFVRSYAWIFAVPVLIFVYAFLKDGKIPIPRAISGITRAEGHKMATFGAFMFSGAVVNIIARTNDTIILASQSKGGLADAAVFTIATYLVTVMDVPQRSLVSITTPFISEAWKAQNLARISTLYQKTALNLMIAGLAIFAIVLLNVREIEHFLGPAYASLSVLVLISGLAKLVDLSTGLNTQILLLSKYWRLDFLTNILLVALSIPLNYWLTRRYNVMGPAYGNVIALVMFNGVRFLFIWRLFKLQPFTRNNGKALGIGLLSFGIVSLLPDTGSALLNISLKTALFVLLYGGLILKGKVSEDIGELVRMLRSRLNW